MKKEYYFCDACGKHLKGVNKLCFETVKKEDNKTQFFSSCFETSNFHLCLDCAETIKESLNQFKNRSF